MAIKHKRTVKPGDVGLAEDWNAEHLIEEETIKLEHLDKAIMKGIKMNNDVSFIKMEDTISVINSIMIRSTL